MNFDSLLRPVAKITTLLVCVAVLSACAPMVSGAMNLTTSSDDVRQKTAKYFGVQVSDLDISNIEKKALSTDYQVRHNGKFYNCTIYYGDVSCKQPGS